MLLPAIILVAAIYGVKTAVGQARENMRQHFRKRRDSMLAARKSLDSQAAAVTSATSDSSRTPRTAANTSTTATAGRHVRFGVGIAAALSTALHSVRLSWHGFRAGWRHGWRHGKERAHAWLSRETVVTTSDSELPNIPPPTIPAAEGTPNPTAPPAAAPPIPETAGTPSDGRVLRFRNRDNMKEVTMPDGEITNYQQVLTHLKGTAELAAAELEDAQAQLARAQQAASHNEQLMAGLARVNVAPEVASSVAPLSEAAQTDIVAAQTRLAAKEHANTTATAALASFQQSYSNLVEAAAAAPSVPDKEFITSQ